MNDDQKIKALELEFDEILTCIKPLYLNCKVPADKSLIAPWIRKLTNLKAFTVDSMHLRNLYLLALFDCMRKEILPDPFNCAPPNNDLITLPNHLKEAIEKFSIKATFNPEWLEEGEEVFNAEDQTPEFEEVSIGVNKYHQDLKYGLIMPFGNINKTKSNEYINNGAAMIDNCRYPSFDNQWGRYNVIKNNIQDYKIKDTDMTLIGDCEPYLHISESFENDEGHGSKLKVNEQGFSNRIQEKEMLLNNITGMERRLAQLQNSYHEDIMKLRSQHDAEVQSLINRKNIEMEQTHKDFNEKMNEQEFHMGQLELKANECMKQLQIFQENKLKEIEQLKKYHNETLDEHSRHNEQKILSLYEDFQKDKNLLISEQKKKEEVLAKETQDYFSKVKADFTEKSNNTNKEIIHLEKDIDELKCIKKRILEQNELLTTENKNLILEIKKLQIDLNETQKRYQFIESQHSRLMQTHDQEIKSVKDTFETALYNMKCAKDEIEIKSHDKTLNLEKQIEILEKSFLELKKNHKNEIDVMELNQNSENIRLKQSYENELEISRSQLRNIQFQNENKVKELEKSLQLKEEKLNQMEKELILKDKSSLQIIEDLRQEMTIDNDRQLRKKQFELDQIETELKYEIHDKSKEVSDLMQQLSYHKQETEIKLTEIRKWSDNQISILTVEWKQEKNAIEQEYKSQLLKTEDIHKNEIRTMKEGKEIKFKELTTEIENLKNHLNKQKNEFEEILQLNKKQSIDLAKSHEENIKNLNFNNKIIIDDLNQQTNDMKLNIEKKHAEQVSQILSKTNDKLKEIEDEYGERSLQSFKMINDLKSMVEKLKKENQDAKTSTEEQINHLVKKCHSEIENYKRIIKINLETYKKELVNEQIKCKHLENIFEKKDQNTKRQLNQLKSEYEIKISKLLPIELQNDFEETIQSLRCQISFLQQRINILEDEVESVNIYKSLTNNGSLKQKCANIFEE